MKVINQTFKKVGIVLLALGIIDLLILLFCIATGHYYSSNFNIFAIVPGIFLIRGGVKTARFMRWISLFAAELAFGLYAIIIISKPLDLILTQFRINTYVSVMDFISGVMFIGVLTWVHFQLCNEESKSALAAAGYKAARPKSALFAGIIIVAISAIGSYMVLTSDAAEKAKSLAAEKVGNDYKFYVSSIEFLGEHGTAVVIVYNSQRVGNLKVEW